MARARILVVMDDPIIRLDGMTRLQAAGLDVVEMDDADDAFAWTMELSNGVAVIFTDVRMAGNMSGRDLARAVAHCFPDAAILVTSGIDLPPTARSLPKPWMPHDDLTAMQRVAA